LAAHDLRSDIDRLASHTHATSFDGDDVSTEIAPRSCRDRAEMMHVPGTSYYILQVPVEMVNATPLFRAAEAGEVRTAAEPSIHPALVNANRHRSMLMMSS